MEVGMLLDSNHSQSISCNSTDSGLLPCCRTCKGCDTVKLHCSACGSDYLSHLEDRIFSDDPNDYPTVSNNIELDATLQTIQTLEAEIAHRTTVLRDVQFKLQSSIATLSKDLALQWYRISPIRRVPAEVLELIFLDVMKEEYNDLITGKMPPIILSHVCQRWREVVNSCSQLWNRLRVSRTFLDEDKGPYCKGNGLNEQRNQLIERTHVCLSRSGSLPLCIKLRETEESLDLLQELYPGFFNMFTGQASRWEEIQATAEAETFLSSIDLSRLTHFSLVKDHGYQSNNEVYGFSFDFLSQAAALKSVHVHNEANSHWDLEGIPYHQLEALSINQLPPAILSSSIFPHLRSLHFSRIHFNTWDLSPGQVCLPSLTSLSLRGWSFDQADYAELVEALSCPRLSNLTLSRLKIDEMEIDGLKTLISQASEGVQFLELEGCIVFPSELETFLHMLSSLRVLVWNQVSGLYDDSVGLSTSYLLPMMRDLKVLPLLREFRFRGRDHELSKIFKHSIIVESLRARLELNCTSSGAVPLQKAELYISQECQSAVAFAEEMEAAGNLVELVSSDGWYKYWLSIQMR